MSAEFSTPDTGPLPLHIRNGTLDDLGALALTTHRAVSWRDHMVLPEFCNDASCYAEIVMNVTKLTAWCHVAEVGKRIGGFVMGHSSLQEETVATDIGTDHLALLMVDPALQQKGIGGALLDEAIKTVQNQGKKHLSLWVGDVNRPAQALYRGRGFEPVDDHLSVVKEGLMTRYVLAL